MNTPADTATPSFRARLIRAITSKYFEHLVSPEGADVGRMRARLDRFARLVPVAGGVDVERVRFADLAAEWLRPERPLAGRVLLYLHGGAYVLGSSDSHRHLVSHIARAAGLSALLPEYRLAPEHPYPAAVEDAVRVYASLLDEGFRPADIVIAGDSAGGGLTMATLLSLREQGLPQPALGCLLSPWLDLAAEGETMRSRKDEDPWFSPEDFPHVTRYYCDDADRKLPLVSPVYADPAGLCPVYIQVGDHEILLSDSERLAENIRSSGGSAELEVWPDMWHVFQAFVLVMPESRAAVEQLASRMRAAFEARVD
ncbi:MAG: alpha/beta hydrolase [Pseudomonadota bacterium]